MNHIFNDYSIYYSSLLVQGSSKYSEDNRDSQSQTDLQIDNIEQKLKYPNV